MSDLKDVHEVQGRDGNWNYSSYMRGLFNGLELALALAEKRDPQYRDPPAAGYLEGLPASDPFAPENQPVPG